MQKYIVKNINTNEISEEDIQQEFIGQLLDKGFQYSNYIKATQLEVDNYNQLKVGQKLQDLKNKKIQELNVCYSSDKCWLFRVYSTKLKAELIKTADWFAKMLPAVDGNIVLFDKNNNIVSVNLKNTESLKINNTINIVKSFQIKQKSLEISNLISLCKTDSEVNLIDIESKFNEVNKSVDIDK